MLLVDMSAVQVKNVPKELHEAVRRRAAEEGLTVSDYVLRVLQRDVSSPSQRQWLARIAEREPVQVPDVAVLIDRERADRGNELRH